MIKLRVPATSANLGPGFDCLGLALQIYNTFEIENSDTTTFENVEECFANDDNLLIQAFRKAGGTNMHVRFDCDIPVSRGLGSSAALISAGIASAHLLKQSQLTTSQMFQLASEMEGHPDNAAPCIYGGLTASLHADQFYCQKLTVHPSYHFTALIPNQKVSTQQARSILPDSYPRTVAAQNTANAICLLQSLQSGDMELLKASAHDQLHEPYRSQLIPHFEEVKKLCTHDTDGVFLISGSGSTCLLISKKSLSQQTIDEISKLDEHWKIIETAVATNGIEIQENDTWHPITIS